MTKPLLKWAGGKTQLLPEILSRIPETMDRYYEPFLGGGAVFFALAGQRRFERAVVGELAGDLVGLYLTIAARPEGVAAALEARAAAFLAGSAEERRRAYYAARAEAPEDPVAAAARLLFLNRTCYNGLYRVNRSGRFNVPYGRYPSPSFPDRETILAAGRHLAAAEVRGPADFSDVTCDAGPGDFVYFDPPYAPLSATANFTGYTAGGFGRDGQLRLLEECARLTAKGVRFLLSNSSGPEVGEMYEGRGFVVERVLARRAINSKGGRRGPVPELLISNAHRVPFQAVLPHAGGAATP